LNCHNPGDATFQVLSLNGVALENVPYNSKYKNFVIKDVFESGFFESHNEDKYFNAVVDSSISITFQVNFEIFGE
jgi:hypothetical protein